MSKIKESLYSFEDLFVKLGSAAGRLTDKIIAEFFALPVWLQTLIIILTLIGMYKSLQFIPRGDKDV